MFGHVHNYERTCSIYKGQCKGLPSKDDTGIDTYDHRNYSAPVQAIIGMAGFSLDQFPSGVSLSLRLNLQIYVLVQVHSSLFFTWNWTLIKQVHNTWSLSRIPEYGYLRGHATKTDIKLEVSIPVNLRLKLILHSICSLQKFKNFNAQITKFFHFFFFMVSVCKCRHKKSSGQLPAYKSIS